MTPEERTELRQLLMQVRGDALAALRLCGFQPNAAEIAQTLAHAERVIA